MIKFTTCSEDIVRLWNEAFGDSKEDIMFFINNVKNAKCLSYYDKNNIASMLFLVECCVDGVNGEYIYAACTEKKSRGFGYMTELLNYAKKHCKSFVCLIPANKSLINYYNQRGFDIELSIDAVQFDESKEIKEYLFEGCELDKPIALMYKGEQ
jgi:GNAT superfamily N-acetyltransferase